ncbi:hypothetical protein [Amycolatopsis sp. MEPSY49]|uniref:hypothetical protein n=1 Tax=Amycolatopsis sp. MEPSY49 TaxID=3151600 RepID=UPI003EFA6ABC
MHPRAKAAPVDDEQTDRRACRAWPTRRGGGYPPGRLVRYRSRVRRAGAPGWHEQVGTVAGHSLRDEHTSTTWVPVRPRGSPADVPASLVRATDILDAHPQGFGDQVRRAGGER